jgi:hypothetical protein
MTPNPPAGGGFKTLPFKFHLMQTRFLDALLAPIWGLGVVNDKDVKKYINNRFNLIICIY